MATETVVAISMIKDEADIVEHTVRRMLDQVDQVIVADNASTDGTREILAGLVAAGAPLVVTDDTEVGYFQSRKMTGLAKIARELGAGWVVPFDADEVWHARGGRIADALRALPPEVVVAQAALYDHVATALDPPSDPVSRIGWRRRHPAELPKVAARAVPGLTILQGNHGAAFEHTDHPLTVMNLLTVRHFPYRSVEQFLSKVRNGAAAYAATDLPEDAGAHWREYGRILAERGEEACADRFRTCFWSPDPATDRGLVFDPCP